MFEKRNYSDLSLKARTDATTVRNGADITNEMLRDNDFLRALHPDLFNIVRCPKDMTVAPKSFSQLKKRVQHGMV